MTSPVGLIVAGGKGTRMARTHPGVPKPLVPVAGIPLIERCVLRLAASGVRDIHVALRHESDRIRAHLSSRAAHLGCRFTFVVEDDPLGTIGALFDLRSLRRTVIVMNGDLLSAIDVDALVSAHERRAADLTIATHFEHHRLRLGEVVTEEDGAVTAYREKPVKSYRISSGTYVVAPPVIDLLERREWLGFPTLVARAIDAGLRVFEHHHDAPWLDVNDAADLSEANRLVARDPSAFGPVPAVRP